MATEQKNQLPTTDPVPRVQVLGKMDGHYAIRCGWTAGVYTLSASRLKFLATIGIQVDNITDNYVL